VDDLNALGDIDLYNNWIWQVPFSSYSGSSRQGQLVTNYNANLKATIGSALVGLEVNMDSEVPWPFGQTFQIQPPVVTGLSPGCVDSGNSFTIHGSGLYPSLVQAVLINGNAVEPQNITTVSDTQLNVIAPDIFDCHFGCPVEVQTNKGTSNTDFNIEISALCGG
jgi:IPT/TIG domain